MLDSAGQSSEVLVRFRETVPFKTQAERLQLDHGKTRSRPPESLKQNLRQKMRGHGLSKIKTWRNERLKIDVAEASELQNSSDVENVVVRPQYSHARANPALVSMKRQKLRKTVQPLAQNPSGIAPVVLTPEFLENKKCQTDTFKTSKQPQPALNDRSEIKKTGRNICFCMLRHLGAQSHVVLCSVSSIIP